ncbi:hypothetical protein R1sor_016581 [Riccia sorocarpa]|uniref:Mitochondrial carrier protein MTM1 n=1 Tax=Riccia sorocarpa TaxID=122646 RepID=A0ABD3HFG4_9MARC
MVAERAQTPRTATAYAVHMLRIDNRGAVNSTPDPKGQEILRDIENGDLDMEGPQLRDVNVKEKAISAAGAAFLSAVIVNPLDVAKTRLQAQAAGVDYNTVAWQQLPRHIESVGFEKMIAGGRCPPVCPRIGNAGIAPLCPPACFQYKSTFDVFNKVIRQEGFFRLWRGTNAALAIAIPTVGIYLPCYDVLREKLEASAAENAPKLKPYAPFVAGSAARSIACVVCAPLELARTRMQARREIRGGVKPPGVVSILRGVSSTVSSASGPLQGIRLMWTGVGAQLARDVPFSAICWGTLEPTRRYLLRLAGPDPSASTVMGANLGAGVLAGTLAAAATCPLDVAKTRRQIEQDPAKALTTRQTLQRIWRDTGVKGLFTGVGPRVARAGPSVAIVVSFYEVVKYFIGTTA